MAHQPCVDHRKAPLYELKSHVPPFVKPSIDFTKMCTTCREKRIARMALHHYHEMMCEILQYREPKMSYLDAMTALESNCCRKCVSVFDHYYTALAKRYCPAYRRRDV